MDIKFLKGIGESRARLFARLGLFDVEDLPRFFPRAYDDRTQMTQIAALLPGQAACVRATVASPVTRAYIRDGLELFKTSVFDDTGMLGITFFNAPYVKNALAQGETYVFYGKADANPLRPGMTNPVFEPDEKAGKTTCAVVPVYPSTAGLTQGLIRSAVRQAIDKYPEPADILPDCLRQEYSLCHARFAIENIHFPASPEALGLARRRLVFEELLVLQLGLLGRRAERGRLPGPVFSKGSEEDFWSYMPFEPTEGQRGAVRDIFSDCRGGYGMNRLVQGDVGSGKTAVAAAAAYDAMINGWQAALMVPTEILAAQHMETLAPLFARMGFGAALLTGRGPAAGRRKVREGLASGEISFVVGTHALISEATSFARLGMVITDEQHRFGVLQRARLTEKGGEPHRLVMSATPIPRTLAQIIYGDLDVSLVKGMPPGRKPVRTYVVEEDYRPRIEAFVRKLVSQGRQVYVVCPLIGEGEDGAGLRSAEEYAADVGSGAYAGLRVGLLHGKVKPAERERVMRAFADGEIDVLVATTVIEVGVNVPNAALMIVENAERFGLSQLHQLRGRVGRGEHESFCVLFLQTGGAVARERLDALRRTSDGFAVAEADLRLRGPGDFFGSRQHGLPEFRIANLETDLGALEISREAALKTHESDPALEKPCHAALREAVREVMRRAENR